MRIETYTLDGENHTVRVFETTGETGGAYFGSRIGTADPYETSLEWLGLDTETHMTARQLEDAASFAEIVRIWDEDESCYYWDSTVDYGDCLALLALVYSSLLALPGILPEIWMDLNNFYPTINLEVVC